MAWHAEKNCLSSFPSQQNSHEVRANGPDEDPARRRKLQRGASESMAAVT